jgi:Niemann-Pick C1 protein
LILQDTDFSLEYADPETDGGLEQDLASRRYRALLPEEEYDSDDY